MDRIGAFFRSTAGRVVQLFVVNVALVYGAGRFAEAYVRADGPAMVDLELSFTAGVFTQITTMWTKAGGPYVDALGLAFTSTWTLDTIFPLAYAAFFSQLYVWLRQNRDEKPEPLLVWLPFVAAGFDYVENVLLLWLLKHASAPSDTLVYVMSIAAVLKFTVLAIAIALSIAELFAGDRGRVFRTSRYSVLSLLIGSAPVILLDQGKDLLVTLASSTQWWSAWIFAFAVILWALSVWYCSRQLLRAEGGTTPSPVFIAWSTWVPRLAGMFTLLLPAAAFFIALPRTTENQGSMKLLGWWCLVMAALFIVFVIKRRQWIVNRDKAQIQSYDPAGIPPVTRWVLGAAFAVSAAMFAWFVADPLGAGYVLGAVPILTIAAANTVFFGSAILFIQRHFRVPLEFVGFACAAAFSLWNDNHDVRHVAAPLAERQPLVEAFRDSRQTLLRSNSSPNSVPVFVVAAEGGGIRAGYWTAAVLAALDAAHEQFGERLIAISSVSGSSFGAAVYSGLQIDEPDRARRGPKARKAFEGGFLAPVLASLVTGDFAQWFIPIPIMPFDRSWAIERSFAEAYRQAAGTTTSRMNDGFLTLRPGAATDRVPLLFFNGTSVDTGRRIVTSPVWLFDPEYGAKDLADLHWLLNGDISLATAAHNTARFPYVSPAGRLRSDKGADQGHIVDGGYFENSGADTARDVIGALRTAFPQLRFIVLVLRNTPDRELIPEESNGTWRQLQELGELFAPLRAVLRTREARAEFALRRLGLVVGAENVIEFAPCPDSTPRADPPLGWELSPEMIGVLDAQVARCTVRQSDLVGQILRGQK